MQVMSETNVKDTRNTVRFARRVNLGDYNHVEASITIEFSGDVIEDRENFEANGRTAFFEAKGIVYSELGAEFAADSDNLIRELFEQAIPGVRPVGPSGNVPTVSGTGVAVEGGTLLGEFEGYPVKLSHSKFGPFIVWGDNDSPQATDGKAFTANVATWDTVANSTGGKDLAPDGTVGAPYTLAKAVKQIQYKASKK